MEIAVRGWSKDHGEKVVAKRDLATAKIGRFDSYVRSETYVTPQSLAGESGVEIRLDAKVILNGDYQLRLALSRNEIANMFFLLNADCSLEELLDRFNAIRSLHEHGPLPRLPFSTLLLKRVDDLELSVRSTNCLKNDGIIYVGDLVQQKEHEMLRRPNFGRKSMSEIKQMLAQMGLRLGMEVLGWRPENIEALAKHYKDLI
jgi:Bacterial RNA polymerase, alpha chain C terminal domain